MERNGPLQTNKLPPSTSRVDDESDEQSDQFFTPETNHQRRNSLQSSSVVEVSPSKDLSYSPSLRARRGLDHCITAPVQRNLFLESQDFAFSRSMTEKSGSPMPALKLDMLSEREKILRNMERSLSVDAIFYDEEFRRSWL